jgi:phosphatidylglycerophosphate synthase
MVDTKFRQSFQRLCVLPVAKFIQNTNTSPKTLTLTSLCSGLLAVPFISFGSSFFSIFFLLVSSYLDNLDGALARLSGGGTKSGAVIDILSDRLVEIGCIFGLYWALPSARAFPCMLMLASMLLCITSFLIIGIFSRKESDKSFHYCPGVIERTEAFCFFILFILFPSWFHFLAYSFVILLLATGALRLSHFLKQAYYDEL